MTNARRLLLLFLASLAFGMGSPRADWRAAPQDSRERKAAIAVEKFRTKMPKRIGKYWEEAYGYAVFPTIVRIGFGFGAAYGRGLVVAQGRVVGRTSFYQITSGMQAGGKGFSMIVFFKDETALDEYRKGRVQFLGQAGVALATFGRTADPAYNSGVAILSRTKGGLMGEATISGGWFRFFPPAEKGENDGD